MALFKIFNNANTKNNLPENYKAGYCYFDVNTGKFYIDTIDDDADGRIPISGEMADKLRTARTITLNGDVTGSVDFDGSNNVTITTEVAADSHEHNSQYLRRDGANNMTGDITFSSSNIDRYIGFITGTTNNWRIGYLGSGSGNNNFLVFQSTKNTKDTWTDALKFGSETLNATFAGKIIAPQGLQGNADTATAFKTAQTITVAGDATGSVTFDGSQAQTLSLDVGSADQLSSNYKINGTAFNGSKDITTASWGTARNVSITDGTNTGTATSMGAATSGSYSLKLPTTIKATLTGNASTATALAKAITIALAGDVSGSASFTGAGDITINTEVADDSHLHTYLQASRGGTVSAATLTVPDGQAKFYFRITNASTGLFPHDNAANAILAISKHEGSYQSQLGFSNNGSLYYRSENGTAFTDETAWKKLAFTSDNVASADKWKTARTLTFKGGANGNVTFDGSDNVECEVTITNDSHTHDTQYLRRNGANYMTGNIYISCSDHDRQICFGTNTNGAGGNRSWRFLYEGTGTDNANYLKIQSSKNTTDTWSDALIFGNDTLDATFGGKVISQSGFEGNATSASKWATARTITLTGGATGSVEIDGSENKNLAVTVTNDGHHHSNSTIDSLDASKITSGTISISRLPQGALERLVVVADDTARFKLTTSNVQLGDVVKVTATDVMYFVKDTANLGNANGYELFAAGRAASVDWANIENVPTLKLAGDATGEIGLSGVAASGKVLNVTIADDSHAHNSQYLRRDGTNYMTGNVTILTGNTDKFIEWKYETSNYGASWRMGYLGSGSSDTNYFVIQNTTSSTSTTAMPWLDIMKITMNTKATTFAGSVTATSFIGNASSASKLETARTIGLGGHVTGSASFNGTKDIVIDVTVSDDSHLHTKLKATGFGGDTSAAGLVPDVGGYAKFFYGFSNNTPGSFPANNYANTILAISRHNNANYNSQLGFSSNGSIYYRAENGTAFTDAVEWKKLAFTSDNVASADKWSTARTLTLSGDVTGEVSFDGSGAISLTTAVTDDSHSHDTQYLRRNGGNTMTGNLTFASASNSDRYISFLTGTTASMSTHNWRIGYLGTGSSDANYLAFQSTKSTTDTWSTAFTLGCQTLNAIFYGTVKADQGFIGNASSASKLATARTLTLSGDVTGSVSFDGSGDVTLTAAVTDDSHLHDGRYLKLAGGTMTGIITTSAGGSTWVSGIKNPAFKISNSTSYMGWISGDVKDGRIGLSTYPGQDSKLYFSYFKKDTLDANTNTPDAKMSWDGSTNTLTATTFAGNATSANKWSTARTITVAGDATGSVSIDGSTDKTLTLDVASAAKTDYALTVNVTNTAGTTTTTTFDGSGAKTVDIDAANFMPLTTFETSMTLGTTWQDITFTKKNGATVASTVLQGNQIPVDGSYIIQITVNDGGISGALSNYGEMYTGVLSWYAGSTNSTDSDEIVLHKAGHASGNKYIFLRTIRTSGNTSLKMQIAANVAATAASPISIKIRKLI